MKYIMIIVGALIVVAGAFALSGLVIWGLGCALIKVFNIDFAFTYWQAIIIAVVLFVIGSYLKK